MWSPEVTRNLWGNFRLMQRRPDLVAKGRYTITSDVRREVFDLFFARVMGNKTAVATAENAEQLRALCDELGFAGLDDEIRALLGGDGQGRRDLIIKERKRQLLSGKDLGDARREANALREDAARPRSTVGKQSSIEAHLSDDDIYDDYMYFDYMCDDDMCDDDMCDDDMYFDYMCDDDMYDDYMYDDLPGCDPQ